MHICTLTDQLTTLLAASSLKSIHSTQIGSQCTKTRGRRWNRNNWQYFNYSSQNLVSPMTATACSFECADFFLCLVQNNWKKQVETKKEEKTLPYANCYVGQYYEFVVRFFAVLITHVITLLKCNISWEEKSGSEKRASKQCCVVMNKQNVITTAQHNTMQTSFC